MKENKVKMNSDKTELISTGSMSKLKQVSTTQWFSKSLRLLSLNQYRILVSSWMSLFQLKHE